MKGITLFVKSFLFIILTIISQTGGLIYLVNSLIYSKNKDVKKRFKFLSFLVIYFIFNLFFTPIVAKLNNREPVIENNQIQVASFISKALNRHYVKPELNRLLQNVSKKLNKTEIKITVLDANFPFFDGFPLIPHLSHNDGKKLDLAFVYQTASGEITDKLKSISGYGVFEEAIDQEINQTKQCKSNGFWQYDLAKYLSFREINSEIQLSNTATKKLIELILAESKLEKLFIEPHLKNRLNLNHSKIRFHGCHAVRHDDHIHIQIK